MQLSTIAIDSSLGHYRSLCSTCHSSKHFQQLLSLSWLVHDLALEGVPLHEDDIDKALDNIPGRHWAENELYERVRRTHRAIEEVFSWASRGSVELELEDLKRFHALLGHEDDPAAGRYRKDSGCPTSYGHDVTKPPSISYRLRKLVEQCSGELAEMHPVRGAATVHWEFMSIWPFDARTPTAGRLLMNYWLMQAGYPPAVIQAKQRQEYVNAIHKGPDAMFALLAKCVDATLRCAESFGERERLRGMVA